MHYAIHLADIIAALFREQIAGPATSQATSLPTQCKSYTQDFTQLERASDGREDVIVLMDVFMKFTVTILIRDQRASIMEKAKESRSGSFCSVPQWIHSDQVL